MMLKHVVELIILVLIEGSYSWNVRCKNDFDRIMTCDFRPAKHTNCLEYSVKVEFYPNEPEQRSYDCVVSSVDIPCHCTTDVGDAGFLYGEDPTVVLRRNGQIIGNSTIITSNHIKPKTPTVISVNQTSEGKSNVTWLTHYKKTYFSEDLKTELKYRSKRLNEDWEYVQEIAIHKTHYVLNNLEPDTEYIVQTRVCFTSNKELQCSEWSEEFAFHSGSSVENVTKKMVPVICLILVLIVCTFACCYVKIKKNWNKSKDSISPKIEAIDNIVGTEYKILCLENTLQSRMEVFLPKEYIGEEEKSITTISVSGSSGNSGQTDGSNSTSVDYGLTCHGEKDQTQVLERLRSAVQQDLERVRQTKGAPQTQPMILPGLSDYESFDMKKPMNICDTSSAPQSNSGCTSGSSFDNQCYSVPTSPSPCESSFFAPSLCCDLGYQSSESFDQPVLMETDGWNGTLPPLIQTDFAYRPCDGCQVSEAECPPQSENVKVHWTFMSQPTEHGQKVNKKLIEPCPLPLGECGPLLSNDDEYRSVLSLVAS